MLKYKNIIKMLRLEKTYFNRLVLYKNAQKRRANVGLHIQAILVALSLILSCSNEKKTAFPWDKSAEGNEVLPSTIRIITTGTLPEPVEKIRRDVKRIREETYSTIGAEIVPIYSPVGQNAEYRDDYLEFVQSRLESEMSVDLVLGPRNKSFSWLSRLGMNSFSLSQPSSTKTISTLIEHGYFAPLQDLLPIHAPRLYRHFPSSFWDSLRDETGVSYGIPVRVTPPNQGIWLIRQSTRESIGFSPITTMTELMMYLAELYEALGKQARFYAMNVQSLMALVYSTLEIDYSIQPFLIESQYNPVTGSGILFYRKGDDQIIYNLCETSEPAIVEVLSVAHRLVEHGVYDKRHVMLKTRNQTSSKQEFIEQLDDGWDVVYIVTTPSSYGVRRDETIYDGISVAMSDPDTEIFDPLEGKTGMLGMSTIDQMLYVSASTKSVPHVLYILENAFTQEVYDLIHLGIMNEHWRPISEDTCEILISQEDTLWKDMGAMPIYLPLPFDSRFVKYHKNLPTELKRLVRVYNQRLERMETDPLTGLTLNFDEIPEAKRLMMMAKFSDVVTGMYTGEIAFGEKWDEFKVEFGQILAQMASTIQRQIDKYIGE